MKETIVVLGGILVILFVGGELFNNNRDVSTVTRHNVVDCASQIKNSQLKASFLTPLNQGISESDARKLYDNCDEALSKEKATIQLESTKSG